MHVIYTKNGKEEQLNLPAELAELRIEHALIHQVLVAEGANARAPHGHSKTRSTVSGGGHKPRPQKGSGRSRQSSVRSPLWVGGAIAFGPKSNRNFTKHAPKTMRIRAFEMALASKISADVFRLIEAWPKTTKTKEMAQFLNDHNLIKGRVLVLLSEMNSEMIFATRNLKQTQLMTVSALGLTDLLVADRIIATKEAFDQLLERGFGLTLDEKPPVKIEKTTKAVESKTTEELA